MSVDAIASDEPQYALDKAQCLKAARALLKHIKASAAEKATAADKKDLLAGDSDDETDDQTPIWLTLTTKKFMVNKPCFRPGKVPLPHPMFTADNLTICLITADPQRAVKDVVAAADFPAALRARVTRVIGLQKLKAKYGQYEAQRQLLAEHDLFLADDRVIHLLPRVLGKTFYRSTTKRPIPVTIHEPAPRAAKLAAAKTDTGKVGTASALPPLQMAAAMEKALSCALVNLSHSTQTSIRIGYAGWDAEALVANLEAVVTTTVDKYTPEKWRNVRAIHIKGPTTAALPIWLASELWVDEKDVLDDDTAAAIQEAEQSKKRKALARAAAADAKKQKTLPAGDDDVLDREISLRKAALKKQKAAVAAAED